MANNLVMNSLNLGLSNQNGNSEFLGVSQKKISEVPSLPDTSEFTEDKTFQLKWNNENKKFEWFEVGG